MLGYPVSTVADIATDPQLEARALLRDASWAPTARSERHCGSFAVIDGERPPLRHVGRHALVIEPRRPRRRAEALP